MLATVSTTVYDSQGHIELNVRADSFLAGEQQRRVTRIPTLDGGSVLNNFGFSHGDRTITLVWENDNQAAHVLVARLTQLYATVITSISDGVYLAAIESYTPKAAECSLRLLVTTKLSS